MEELVRIPAFTGEEAARAKYCLGWLDNQGIFGGRTDGAGNVVWRYQPENPDAVLVTAHLDTVFPMDTPLKIETDGDILRCPGISDNTVHGMLLLLAAKYLKEEKPKLPYGLILAWDTGEEGLGNLAGCKALVKTYGERLLGVLALDLLQGQDLHKLYRLTPLPDYRRRRRRSFVFGFWKGECHCRACKADHKTLPGESKSGDDLQCGNHRRRKLGQYDCSAGIHAV